MIFSFPSATSTTETLFLCVLFYFIFKGTKLLINLPDSENRSVRVPIKCRPSIRIQPASQPVTVSGWLVGWPGVHVHDTLRFVIESKRP